MTIIKRQYITDAGGHPIGVLLPIEEFVLVEETLDHRLRALQNASKLEQMQQAANDPLFLADMQETMETFTSVDAEWWEREE